MKAHAVIGFAALNPSYEASAAQNGSQRKASKALIPYGTATVGGERNSCHDGTQ